MATGGLTAFSACASFIRTQQVLIFITYHLLLSTKFIIRHFNSTLLYLLDIQAVAKLWF